MTETSKESYTPNSEWENVNNDVIKNPKQAHDAAIVQNEWLDEANDFAHAENVEKSAPFYAGIEHFAAEHAVKVGPELAERAIQEFDPKNPDAPINPELLPSGYKDPSGFKQDTDATEHLSESSEEAA